MINVREINAFALPGGPMFVNRGMIEAAKSEGEVAGVMAHELSHVVLRHGTAQASKATKYEVGQVAGAVLGAIIGGPEHVRDGLERVMTRTGASELMLSALLPDQRERTRSFERIAQAVGLTPFATA